MFSNDQQSGSHFLACIFAIHSRNTIPSLPRTNESPRRTLQFASLIDRIEYAACLTFPTNKHISRFEADVGLSPVRGDVYSYRTPLRLSILPQLQIFGIRSLVLHGGHTGRSPTPRKRTSPELARRRRDRNILPHQLDRKYNLPPRPILLSPHPSLISLISPSMDPHPSQTPYLRYRPISPTRKQSH